MQVSIDPILYSGKFLLGFSGGADSVALFFCLLEKHIDFDIAIVDYKIRTQSEQEISYAKQLANSYNKQCHHTRAPTFSSNFEAQARNFRYEFFSMLIAKHNYMGLLLAHNFNDRIEWLLLRLGKGSGIAGLLGFDEIAWHYPQTLQATTHYPPYPIIRPLLWCNKQEIIDYCSSNHLRFFTDSTNIDTSYERNFIRTHLSTTFIKHYAKGLQESMKILTLEREVLYRGGFFIPQNMGNHFICIYAFETHQAIHHIANALKTQGYVLSRKQREEIIHTNFSCEIYTSIAQTLSHTTNTHTLHKVRFCIEHFPNTRYPFAILIARYSEISLPKLVKEQLRRLRFPKRLRPSLYAYSLQESISLQQCIHLITQAFLDKEP